MALIECHFFSEALGLSTSLNAIIPQPAGEAQIGIDAPKKRDAYPVLYLLHGMSDDHSIWERRTSIERYAASYDIAIIMPNVHRSFYTDMATGQKYWTFLNEELPKICKHFFPISDDREDTFVAGLSMGGYGAFKWALNCPEKICAAASLSGALNMVLRGKGEFWSDEMNNIFGSTETLEGSMNDLIHMASETNNAPNKPMLWQWCGTEDFLYESNTSFRDHMNTLDYDYAYFESEGTHEWGAWDREIQNILKWLPIQPA